MKQWARRQWAALNWADKWMAWPATLVAFGCAISLFAGYGPTWIKTLAGVVFVVVFAWGLISLRQLNRALREVKKRIADDAGDYSRRSRS